MSVTYIGYHGTSYKSAKSISSSSHFEPSLGDDQWLGDGAYFFIKGLSKAPDLQAEKWAIASSFDKVKRSRKYNQIAVIKSKINSTEDACLDLRTSDGVEVLEYLLHRFKDKILSFGKKLDYLDGLVINFARLEGVLDVDLVIGNFYIKFEFERIHRLNLRTSNCTICAVFNRNSIQDFVVIKTKFI